MATALLEKQKPKQPETGTPAETGTPEAAEVETGPILFRWTVDAFNKACDAGVFGHEKRLELIQGRIWETMGQGPRHSTLASIIADMLHEAAGKAFAVREEKPVQLAFDSQPLPDVLVLKGRQTDYNGHQPMPEDVALIVEVSVTTVVSDLGEKAEQYAQAGINEYWVVVEKEDAIVVHRKPSQEGYQEVVRLSGEDALSALALPETVWTVDVLLGKSDA